MVCGAAGISYLRGAVAKQGCGQKTEHKYDYQGRNQCNAARLAPEVAGFIVVVGGARVCHGMDLVGLH